jgi:uncharacterized membrane protein YhhN
MDAPSILPVLGAAALISAASAIAAYYRRPPRSAPYYIFKPLTTVLILAVAVLPGTFPGDAYAGAICVGLVFSLIGDILLMLPGDLFLHGLISFLTAHLCYIYGFVSAGTADNPLWPALLLIAIGAAVLVYIFPALSRVLKAAVTLYVVVIVTMAALAAGRAAAHASAGTMSAAAGALLFMASDAVKAVDRYRRPFRLAQAVVLGTYFVGQLLIALSVALPAA